ncbi:hypothetical protein ACOJCM_05010 [Billgrantia sp. LNSP4103-1]|uniref:hypothetical protein n=1 Tax=Billgrantia sp. LNSP4103-1 TaxID=3410266 RepID=UPI00403F7926
MNTHPADGKRITRQLKTPGRLRLLLGTLLFGLAWCSADVALGEDGRLSFESGFDVFPANDGESAWQELDAAHLEGVRGRYVAAAKLELDEPWAVILWDETQGSRTKGRTGSQQSQGNNRQQQSINTTRVR